MAPRTILIAATLLGAALVNASPKPAPLPLAFAQTDGLPQCLNDCLLEYATSPSALKCIGNKDPSTISQDELMVIVNCWCTDSSRAGASLDTCAASCSDGSDDMWTTLCSAAGGGGIPEEPVEEESTTLPSRPRTSTIEEEEESTTIPSRPTRTIVTDEEEETDDADFPSETEDVDEPTETDDGDDAPTTTRIRRPTGTAPAEQDDNGNSAQRFLPHAGALALGLLAAIVAL